LAKVTKKLVRRHTFGWFLGGGSFALANSPGFSLSETALIVKIISQRIPFIFTDRVPAMFVPYLNSLIPHNYISLNFINSFNG
jgi:hypothetical protein